VVLGDAVFDGIVVRIEETDADLLIVLAGVVRQGVIVRAS